MIEKCVAAQHYCGIGKQLFILNDRHRVHWEVLSLSQILVKISMWRALRARLIKWLKFNLPPLKPVALSCRLSPSKCPVSLQYIKSVCLPVSHYAMLLHQCRPTTEPASQLSHCRFFKMKICFTQPPVWFFCNWCSVLLSFALVAKSCIDWAKFWEEVEKA